MNITNLLNKLIAAPCLVLACLATSCVPRPTIQAEERYCKDEQGNPLEGVVAIYNYTGTSSSRSYVWLGGYAISDKQGILHLPAEKVMWNPASPGHYAARETTANDRVVTFLFCEKLHATLSDSFRLEHLAVYIKTSGRPITYTFKDISNDPDLWYQCLKVLCEASDSFSNYNRYNKGNPTKNPDIAPAIGVILAPIANREKQRFLEKWGDRCPADWVTDAYYYAEEHKINRSATTFRMTVSDRFP